MSDAASGAPAPARRANDGKTSNTGVLAAGTSAAGGAATVLYLLGCLKGHQWYQPDDAVVLFWVALMAPAAKVLYEKFNKWVGVPADADA